MSRLHKPHKLKQFNQIIRRFSGKVTTCYPRIFQALRSAPVFQKVFLCHHPGFKQYSSLKRLLMAWWLVWKTSFWLNQWKHPKRCDLEPVSPSGSLMLELMKKLLYAPTPWTNSSQGLNLQSHVFSWSLRFSRFSSRGNFAQHNVAFGYGFSRVGCSQCSLRKFYTEQMFVLVRIQFHNHVDTQSVKRFKRCKGYGVSNPESCKCARIRFHCANALVVLRSCAP